MSNNLLNKLTQLKLPAMAGSLIGQRETSLTYDELSFEERLNLLADDELLNRENGRVVTLYILRISVAAHILFRVNHSHECHCDALVQPTLERIRRPGASLMLSRSRYVHHVYPAYTPCLA